MPNLELASPVDTYLWTCGSTSGLMRISTLTSFCSFCAAARMLWRSNSLSTLMRTPCSTASSSSQGCLPLPLKTVLQSAEARDELHRTAIVQATSCRAVCPVGTLWCQSLQQLLASARCQRLVLHHFQAAASVASRADCCLP